MGNNKKLVAELEQRQSQRAADKEWVKSPAGQEALIKARLQAESAIKHLELRSPILTELVKHRFAR